MIARAVRIHAWSMAPDERHLVYVTTDAATREQSLVIVSLPSGEPRELLRLKPPQQISNRNAATDHNLTWTPDSLAVAFIS